MITSYTSIKRVISKVFTDLDLKEGDHRISDMIEWGAEALEKIGAFPYFVTKVTGREGEPALELIDYQCKIPRATNKILQIAYAESVGGPYYPMRYNTGTFDVAPVRTVEVEENNAVFSESELISVAMSLYRYEDPASPYYGQSLSYTDALAKINNDANIKSLIVSLLMNNTQNKLTTNGGETMSNDFTYSLSGGYIKTNKKTGYLMVAYQAVPTDDDGFPLIPDDSGFIEALYWYITMKLYYPDWKAGRIRDEVYYDSRRSWNYYCKQAYGNALMPNNDQLETIKNIWIRLKPDMDAHSTFYTNLGDREKYFNQDSPRYNSYYEKVFYK